MLETTFISAMEMALESSLSEPPRSTMARSGSPPRSRVARNPAAIARIATITPTTPAMPTTITAELPRRDGRFFRFMRVISRTWPSMGGQVLRSASAMASRFA